MLLVTNLADMTKTLAHGNSCEGTKRELSNEYQQDGLDGFQKSLYPCPVTKVASALEGLIALHNAKVKCMSTSTFYWPMPILG